MLAKVVDVFPFSKGPSHFVSMFILSLRKSILKQLPNNACQYSDDDHLLYEIYWHEIDSFLEIHL